MLRLLELQSDLMQREGDYERIYLQDSQIDCATTQSYQRDWERLDESQGIGGTSQRDAWRDIRDRLDAYSRDLQQCYHPL